ncbi:MAG: tRNA (adenosine(37)-N6)-dimethylallyltransferase MiaA [Filomicrobium sp.]
MEEHRPLLIAGPTASGKSAFAMQKAHESGGVIVNADSMQVYSQLRVLTARPTEADEIALPHRLYGHVDIAHSYSVAQWLRDVEAELVSISEAGQRLIIVGGTGLYFNALTMGLSPIPEIDPEVRVHWRGQALELTPQELYAELSQRDPLTAATLRDSDPQRLVRALEVIESTGRPLAQWQTEPGVPLLAPGTWDGCVVCPERDEIYARADNRFEQMLDEGALEEVEALKELQLSPELPGMRALGVKPLMGYLDGVVSREDAVEAAKTQTRRYVKRQLTWLRRYMISENWLIIE